MLSRGSLRRSTYSGVWGHFPHSARSTGRSVFNIIIASSSSSSSILSSSSRTSTTTQPHMHHGDHQVPQLVKMIGPDPSKFSGLSARVDEQLGWHRHHHHHQSGWRTSWSFVMSSPISTSWSSSIFTMKPIDIMITIIFIVQPLWRLGWRTSRCSDTSSPISSTSGLSHRTLVRGATGAFGKRRISQLFLSAKPIIAVALSLRQCSFWILLELLDLSKLLNGFQLC